MRRQRAIIAAVVLVAVGVGVAYWRSTPATAPAVVFPAPAAAAQVRIEHALAEDRAFRDDVVFLLVATLRDRCRPADTGLLARMANRAVLPILGAVSAVTLQHPDLDRPVYQFIQHLADSTTCDQPLRLPVAAGAPLEIDIEQYARTFPDSYFDPQRSSVPVDFGGRSLAERSGDACNSVVYSLLPLGGTDWRCSSLRAQARARVHGLCEDELQRQHGHSGGELDMAVGQGMQAAVVKSISALPQACR